MERISRADDDRCYQPKIHSERIRQLYILKEITGIPMTVLLDRAIEVYVTNHVRESDASDESDIDTSGDLHNGMH